MRLVRFDATRGREIDAYGSVGFLHARLVATHGEARVDVVRLAAGGRIGGHPAASLQVFAVVEGSAVVSGGDGAQLEIEAGTAAVWEAGEEHETTSDGGLVAVVVQADAAELLAEP